jgi:putative lipoprotein (rSAM/lipoprotein system)
MKNRLLKISNIFFAAILALFGINSCQEDDLYAPLPSDFQAEYGCRPAGFVINGQVTNENGDAINNIQVVWPEKDTSYTNANGNFSLISDDNPGAQVRLYFNDTDGPANGSYQNDSADVQMEDFGDGTGYGSAYKTLKAKTE